MVPRSSPATPWLSLAKPDPDQIVKFPLLQLVRSLIQLEASQINKQQIQLISFPGASLPTPVSGAPAKSILNSLAATYSAHGHLTLRDPHLCSKHSLVAPFPMPDGPDLHPGDPWADWAKFSASLSVPHCTASTIPSVMDWMLVILPPNSYVETSSPMWWY